MFPGVQHMVIVQITNGRVKFQPLCPHPEASALPTGPGTYNCPNPAPDDPFLRVLTTEDAEVSVKIITLSGQAVYDGIHHPYRGIPQEIEIDTRSWSSGGYIGLVTAESGRPGNRNRSG